MAVELIRGFWLQPHKVQKHQRQTQAQITSQFLSCLHLQLQSRPEQSGSATKTQTCI
jgi:hypothetical protein